jgi:cell division protein FtsN
MAKRARDLTMSRYFEIIITGRQLAAGVAAVILLLALAFGLGVAVRWFEPTSPPQEYIAGAPLPPTAAPAPTIAMSAVPTGVAGTLPTSAPTTPVAQVATAASAAPTPVSPVATMEPAAPTPAAAAKPTRLPAATGAPAASATPVIAVAKPPERWVQATALSRRDQAEGVRTHVMALGFTAGQVVVQPAPHGKFRVRVGPFPDGESAGRVAARLQAQGFKGAFVVNAGE